MRVRLKVDGRLVELRDGGEVPLVPDQGGARQVADVRSAQAATPANDVVRALRARMHLTQTAFADRLGVPVETIRNWEQGKRVPRGPSRALLTVIEHAPEIVFAALARDRDQEAVISHRPLTLAMP